MRTRLLYIATLGLALMGLTLAGPGISPAWAQESPAPSSRALILESVESRPADRGVELVLWRWLELEPGDEITSDTLLLARERLLSSGYFKELELYTARGSAPGQVVLVVEGKLDRSTHFQTGFGYEPLDGWYLNLIGARWNSPFHRGGFLRVGWSVGLRTRGLYADWLRPSTIGSLDLAVSGRLGNQQWIAWIDDTLYRQDITRNQIAIGLGRSRRRGASAQLWIAYGSAKPDSLLREFNGDDEIDLNAAFPEITQTQNLWQTQLDLSLDHRDDRIAPHRGGYLGTRLRAGLVDGDQGYFRALADARRFFALPGRSVLGLRAHGAWSSQETPYYERFIFGGVDNLRGFADASLSGPRGASAFVAGTLELRTPLIGRSAPESRIDGILFIDGGTHWDADGAAQSGSLGIGYGLRVRLPWVQRIGVDVGIPLTESPTGDPFWIHLSLGYSF